MRFKEIAGGFQIPLSEEEMTLVSKIEETNNKYPRNDMNQREKEVARKLLSRGVLNFYEDDKKHYFEVNKLEEIERY